MAFIHVAIGEWASCDPNLSTRLDIQTKDHLKNPDRKSVLSTQGTLSHYSLKSFPKLIRLGIIQLSKKLEGFRIEFVFLDRSPTEILVIAKWWKYGDEK